MELAILLGYLTIVFGFGGYFLNKQANAMMAQAMAAIVTFQSNINSNDAAINATLAANLKQVEAILAGKSSA